MTDTAATPEPLPPALAAYREEYDRKNISKLSIASATEHTDGVFFELFRDIPDLYSSSPAEGKVIKDLLPSREEVTQVLEEMRAHPKPPEATIEFLETLIREEYGISFLGLTDMVIEERNRLLIQDFLRHTNDIDGIYSGNAGFTARKDGARLVTASAKDDTLCENNSIPADEYGRLFMGDYPIGVAKDLKALAEDIGLEPQLVTQPGSKVYALMFSGQDVELLRDAGAKVEGSFQELAERSNKATSFSR